MMKTMTISWILGITFSLALVACGGGESDSQCAAGELECACLPADTCAIGLACIDKLCQPPSELGFTVSDSDARSCEMVLHDGPAKLVGATFGDQVTGVHIRQGDDSALSFFANDDEAIPDGAMALQVVEGPTGSTADIKVVRARCFDRDGGELANVTVDLGR